MRFVLTALVWLFMVGGLGLYIHERDRRKPPEIQAAAPKTARMEDFTLEITPTFTTEADPFALRGEAAASATLVVKLAERELFRGERPLAAGETVSVHPVPGLVLGRNELYLRATPPLEETHKDNAVRVRLLQGNREVLDETLWGRGGANVAGTIPFTLTGAPEAGHEH
jgi:hypothetical protein